jgi:tetratricopeptide (TPR) repeat protein
VFNQVLPSDDDKYDVLARLMQAINIDYSSDRETWTRMIRGRAVAEMFATVELGRLFYDKAEEIAPNESFVFHQRAVFEMQHRRGSLVLAEVAARKAFERSEYSRSIQHTQAEIARRQAVDAKDPLRKQALRRTAREKLSRGSGRPTEYDISTRARLAIDEFRELLAAGQEELDKGHQAILLEAAKEAETTIQSGLQAFPNSPEILAVEASVRELLEQAERARQALERAFGLNPRQDWLAVRLARSYSQAGNPGAASRILERCLQENSSSKIAHLEMAHIARRLGKSQTLVLDHLRRSFISGDNHFEGQFWYGRELFIQGRSEDAKTAFRQVDEHAPSRYRTDASALMYDSADRVVVLKGRVERKEYGYAFIRFADFKEAIFASRADSDYDEWKRLANGASVLGKLAFNRRGPCAVRPTPES